MSTFIESIDLWASAKFIGRQCSTVNKNYLLCRENFINDNPTVCTQEGDLVHACAANVVSELKQKLPTEFEVLKKCLDYNDYRFNECRKQEKALREAWNALKKE